MKELKLMNLTRVSLSPVLVSSLGALVKLRTLCLDHCKLTDITMIGELRMLQALSLIDSSIVSVPKEIAKLGSTLKILDLSHCRELETIAAGVISSLTLLEDMRIGESYITWERLESNDSDDGVYESKVVSLEEFKNLQNLNNLEICIPDHAGMFPKDLIFEKFEAFKIFFGVGNVGQLTNSYEFTRSVKVDEVLSTVEFDSEGIKALMARAESLCLSEIKTNVSVSEMVPKGFPELKDLKVHMGRGIQYIVRKNCNNCVFPKLETLELFHVYNLEKFCDDRDHPLPVGSFEKLSVINVWNCILLNDLFSSNLARRLLRLEEIKVSGGSMESIIACRESENEEELTIGFTHQLRVLDLSSLPQLVSFCSFKGLPSSPPPFFNKKIVFPKLEELNLFCMEIEKIWDDHLATAPEGTSSFQNLTNLKIFRCHKLRYLFTFSMIKVFGQLKHLEITSCDFIEEIVVATSKEEMEGDRLGLFPKLELIEFNDLDNFTSFCSISSCNFQFPSLDKVIVDYCLKMKFFYNGTLSTPKLLRVWPRFVKNKDEEKLWQWRGDLNSTILQIREGQLLAN